MDLIRYVLSLLFALFPQLLHHAAVPLATTPLSSSGEQIRQFAIGNSWLGWYRMTLLFRPYQFPQFKLVDLTRWGDQPLPDRDRMDSNQAASRRPADEQAKS